MTREKYYMMCEQMGRDPIDKEIPPEIIDFPFEIQKAILIYNKLGDRIFPDIGYLGKDYTQLPIYLDVLEIENRELFLETLLILDSKVITKSQKALKAERDKIKQASKNKG